MLQSMTGFGKENAVIKDKKISVEIRSLNSKGLDLTVKLPSSLRELESEIRNIVSTELDRGKIDVGVYVESEMGEMKMEINKDLANQYYHELKNLNEKIGQTNSDYLSLILKQPNIVQHITEEVSSLELEFIMKMVSSASDQLIEFRIKEGEKLVQEFNFQLEQIKDKIKEIEQVENERMQGVKSRIQKGLKELEISNYDLNRFEQEMIYYIEKLDISEEKMRLKNHIEYFKETMDLEKSGKKLGFIAQEMGREINTLGSKSNHSGMQHMVVEMKDCLEKIKEQIANTL